MVAAVSPITPAVEPGKSMAQIAGTSRASQLFQLQLGKLGWGGAPGVMGRLRLAEEAPEHVGHPVTDF